MRIGRAKSGNGCAAVVIPSAPKWSATAATSRFNDLTELDRLIVRPELSLRLARENAFDSFILEIEASIAGAKDWLTMPERRSAAMKRPARPDRHPRGPALLIVIGLSLTIWGLVWGLVAIVVCGLCHRMVGRVQRHRFAKLIGVDLTRPTRCSPVSKRTGLI